jgi:hypothetical protein
MRNREHGTMADKHTTSGGTRAAGSSALIVTTDSIPNGVMNADYAAQLGAAGGNAPYTWAMTDGDLPAGLKLSSGGVLSGVPTEATETTFTAQVTDGASAAATQELTISVTSKAEGSENALTRDALARATQVGENVQQHGTGQSALTSDARRRAELAKAGRS